MYVTLAGAIVTAVFDPLLIFGLRLGVDGAAIVSVLSRIALAGVGLHGCIRVHGLLARPRWAAAIEDASPLAAIAVPAVLTNVATPIANAFVTSTVAAFGDSAVAGFAVIGRIVPLAFGAIFALSGSVGPILGQNHGARRFDRLERTITDSLTFTLAYCALVWALLLFLQQPIVWLFGASGEGAALIWFFCRYVAGTFVFLGALFVANAAFNNLGFPTWSTVFNWGRATLGTIPFVTLGASYMGAEGALAGQAAGGVLFGVAAVLVCYGAIRRLAASALPGPMVHLPLDASAVPPLSSDKAATALEWLEGGTEAEALDSRMTGELAAPRGEKRRPPGGPAGA
jgi:Na+-driven multidrug efflux pump